MGLRHCPLRIRIVLYNDHDLFALISMVDQYDDIVLEAM